MSYSFRGTASDGEITEWVETPQQGYAEAESVTDLGFVKELATALAKHLGGDVTISGGGHANPDRTPESSWASDMAYLNVSRVPVPRPAEAVPVSG